MLSRKIFAGPLLVASLTHDPFLVSLAFLCEFLPSLVFGSIAGVVVDRADRRRIMIVVNLLRAAVLLVLAASIVSGAVGIAVVLAALLVLGTAETFGDLAASSLLPRLVARSDLGIANARLQGAFILTNQVIGPPIGAFLFAAGMAIPFLANGAAYVLGAVLIARMAASVGAVPHQEPGTAQAVTGDAAIPGRAAARAMVDELLDGLRWLLGHPPMRTLALTIFAFNVTYGAAWSVLVLYAVQRLGMDEVGFGLLTTAMAIGGVIGTASYGRLERRFSLAGIMRTGLLIETATHLVLAITTAPGVALATMLVFGGHAFVWGTTATAVRQRAVPDELMGRVGGIYRVGLNAGIVVGTPVGGLLARQLGITAPFWFGFVGSAILVALLWRELGHIAHDPGGHEGRPPGMRSAAAG